jgi:Spy/CpxP family protein refolding chaperone
MKMSLTSLIVIVSALYALPAFSADTTDVTAADKPSGDTASQIGEFSDILASQNNGTGPANQEQSDKKQGPCGKVDLDEAQKAQVRDAVFASEKNKITLKASLQEAILSYKELVVNPSTTVDEANTASTAINTAKSTLGANRSELKNQILFSILRPEQRKPAIACFRFIRKHHHKHDGKDGHEHHHQW